MSHETLTTWKCGRCGFEVVTDSADTPPKWWTTILYSIPDNDSEIEDDLCVECSEALGRRFMQNEPTAPYIPDPSLL